MAKKVQAYVKLQIPAAKANPSPPVGPALGQQGVNIMEFCKQFNAATQKMEPGMPIPVIITGIELAVPGAATADPTRSAIPVYSAQVIKVDADRPIAVVGASPGVDEAWVKAALMDNPAGNEDEQTPVVILRRL